MKQVPEIGDNLTVRSKHPKMYEEMKKGADDIGPTSLGDGTAVAEVRVAYAKNSGPIGHVPRPSNGDQVETALADLIDKLGERLAFERSGTRFYDALLSKHDAFGSFDGGPSRADLEEIRREEHAHFLGLERVIDKLGGDSAAVTPSANLVATVSRGIGDVCVDPRTTLLQCLEAILVAELADNDGWEVLMGLARRAKKDALVEPFQAALDEERDHLARVRSWIEAGHRITVGAEDPASSPR